MPLTELIQLEINTFEEIKSVLVYYTVFYFFVNNKLLFIKFDILIKRIGN